nr:hypothetical protein [Chromobacterium violaceum]
MTTTDGSTMFTSSNPNTVSPHQGRDAMSTAGEALCKKFGMNTPMAINTIDLGMHQPDFT